MFRPQDLRQRLLFTYPVTVQPINTFTLIISGADGENQL